MGLWTMVAVIVVAATIGEVLKAYFKSKDRAEKVDGQLKDRFQRYESELEALRKRVRNLEAIAATSPDEFTGQSMADADNFDFESEDEFNKKLINQLAKKKTKS